MLTLIVTTNKTMTQNTNRPVKDAKGLSIGDIVNNFTAKDIHDSIYSLNDALKNSLETF